MRELLTQLLSDCHAGLATALATVVSTAGSAPRPPGTSMLVHADGSVTGGVSGGCVDAAVLDAANRVRTGGPAVLLRFHADEDPFAPGLSCGGSLEVFVARADSTTFPMLPDIARRIEQEEPVTLATVIQHHDPTLLGTRMALWPGKIVGTLGGGPLDEAVSAAATTPVDDSAVIHHYSDEIAVFIQTFVPLPRLLIFGSGDYGIALSRLGSFLGYRITVCDPRSTFTTAEHFPDVEAVVDWPSRYLRTEAQAGRLDTRTAVTVLGHDPKVDVPLLIEALRCDIGYVGAMGSRRTCAERERLLREAGLTETELARLSAPIGLDLGARSPAETAISIAAELIAARQGGSGIPLRRSSGPIHR